MVRTTAGFPAAAALLAAACATPAPEPQPASAATIPLGDYLGVLNTIDVTVAGEASRMILDTGGGVTAITPDLAQRIGCQPWGQLTGFQATGAQLSGQRCSNVALSLAAKPLTTQDIGVFDLSALLPPQGPRIDGLFSLDALAHTPFTLDLAAARLTLETHDSLAARTTGTTEIPIRLTRQAGGASLTVMAAIPTPSGDLWMQLDAGSDAALQLAPSSARALGIDPDQPPATTQLILVGRTEGVITEDAAVTVRDLIIDGNIGIPVLRRWVMTFDLASERLWIVQTAAPQAE